MPGIPLICYAKMVSQGHAGSRASETTLMKLIPVVLDASAFRLFSNSYINNPIEAIKKTPNI
jgi:hypothetical protein